MGDGLIAECLMYAIETAMPSASIDTIDLAGRVGHAAEYGKNRRLYLKVMKSLPKPLRLAAVCGALLPSLALRLGPGWAARLRNADILIIGGGQIFADSDLNFPLKLSTVLRQAHATGTPVAIHSVGVSADWSTIGRHLLRSALTKAELVYASVRDGSSAAHMSRLFLEGSSVQIRQVRDPGLLASRVYPPRPASEPPDAGCREIGINISHPDVLGYHSDRGNKIDPEAMACLYLETAEKIHKLGLKPVLFTNGSPEDHGFMTALADRLIQGSLTAENFRVVPRPTTPSELIETISSFHGVIAHRLHANIAAYSFRIPHVGLPWDRKVDSFFASVGREAFMIPVNGVTSDIVVSTLAAALEAGIDPGTHHAVLNETAESIRGLLQAVQAHRAKDRERTLILKSI
ncbi:hypothetical protein N825_21835 [Skermanella stibiiresistens SB22]|uniref:Polysaccharide pyruvyl transferase domain-containing protein n=1 Tax=Skermanella stibiiresistens SB22 TaxID=1385369 RepID=W9GT62_9PROT|nr:hypothetical protein N825_21835 [Skermanella stibiiresistens SB22]